MNRQWKIAMVVALAAAAGSMGAAQRVAAYPGHQVVTSYYSNPAKTIWCGTKTFTCDADVEMDGVVSPYYKQYNIPCHM